MNHTTQASNPGKYAIGQQAMVIRSDIRTGFEAKVKPFTDAYGFVTVKAVREYQNGFTEAHIGGETWIPFSCLVF